MCGAECWCVLVWVDVVREREWERKRETRGRGRGRVRSGRLMWVGVGWCGLVLRGGCRKEGRGEW